MRRIDRTVRGFSRPVGRQATQHLLGVVEAHLSLFVERDDQSLPAAGVVRFYLLASSGPRRVDVEAAVFWGRVQNPLMPVIAATQRVIAAIQDGAAVDTSGVLAATRKCRRNRSRSLDTRLASCRSRAVATQHPAQSPHVRAPVNFALSCVSPTLLADMRTAREPDSGQSGGPGSARNARQDIASG